MTERLSPIFTPSGRRAALTLGATGQSPLLLVCEHASSFIPDHLGALGLAPEDRLSHAVWDPGAEDLTRGLAARLDAPAVLATVSRLVHDCNRPAGSEEAMPARVETITIPDNADLDLADRKARADGIYHPFHRTIDEALTGFDRPPILVTVHSFSPTWHGVPRRTEIGILHDADPALAMEFLAHAGNAYATELNAPYSAKDGVTHTLARHGPRCAATAMIEVRNDLLADDQGIEGIADALAAMISKTLDQMAARA